MRIDDSYTPPARRTAPRPPPCALQPWPGPGRRGKGTHKSSNCRDDKIMVNRKFFRQDGSKGRCVELTRSSALGGIARNNWNFSILGKKSLVLTKAWVTHPHRTSKRVGIVLFKRLVTHTCTGENPASCTKGATVADVHKVGYCVKCHFNVFRTIYAALATKKERISFVQKCLPKAVDEKGNIKPAFQCTGEDKKKAMASISAF